MEPIQNSLEDQALPLTSAAAYVRMSTEHQQYSTSNQMDVIRDFAKRRGMQITKDYSDEGKSGLNIKGRDSLAQMIQDVQDGKVNFSSILVYDVSRWGRFQDADESAYYEYICRRAGVAVHYCAEQFENDGTPSSTIIKTVKRAMAGEYSRELSAKVFQGACRLIQLGFKQGGTAGFGLRWMYDAFVKETKSEWEIADLLNERGILTDFQRPWTRGTVHEVLTNEKYLGHNVYHRTSCKLKQKHVENPPEKWIRADNAFVGIVDSTLFLAAQSIILTRSQKLSDEEMLEKLR